MDHAIEVGLTPEEVYHRFEEDVANAVEESNNRAFYRLELQLRQMSETNDPHVQAHRYTGFIRVYERGSHYDEESKMLIGADGIIAFCRRQVDTGKKDRHRYCNNLIDHAFIHGRHGYCTSCRSRIKFKVDMAEVVSFSEGSVRIIAANAVAIMRQLDPSFGVDVLLERYLGDVYKTSKKLIGGDIGARAAWAAIKRGRQVENVIIPASSFRKAMETGQDPAKVLEMMIKA